MRNKFIRLDYKFTFTIIYIIISVCLILLSIYLQKLKYLSIIITIIMVLFCYFPITRGIVINYKKKYLKSKLFDVLNGKKIDFSDIWSIELIEIKKNKKKYSIFGNFINFRYNYEYGRFFEPDYVYRNGKVFNIIIRLKGNKKHNILYGVLYKERSKKKVDKQEDKIRKYFLELNEYLKIVRRQKIK